MGTFQWGHRQTEAKGQAETVRLYCRCDTQSTQGPCQEGHGKQTSRMQESWGWRVADRARVPAGWERPPLQESSTLLGTTWAYVLWASSGDKGQAASLRLPVQEVKESLGARSSRSLGGSRLPLLTALGLFISRSAENHLQQNAGETALTTHLWLEKPHCWTGQRTRWLPRSLVNEPQEPERTTFCWHWTAWQRITIKEVHLHFHRPDNEGWIWSRVSNWWKSRRHPAHRPHLRWHSWNTSWDLVKDPCKQLSSTTGEKSLGKSSLLCVKWLFWPSSCR